jgi:hypothetical protein
MTLVMNSKTVDTFSTLKEGMEEFPIPKGNQMTTTMTLDDDDKRLTPKQRAIRDRNADLPKHVRRSIDRYRVALGFVPLWGSSLDQRQQRRRA